MITASETSTLRWDRPSGLRSARERRHQPWWHLKSGRGALENTRTGGGEAHYLCSATSCWRCWCRRRCPASRSCRAASATAGGPPPDCTACGAGMDGPRTGRSATAGRGTCTGADGSSRAAASTTSSSSLGTSSSGWKYSFSPLLHVFEFVFGRIASLSNKSVPVVVSNRSDRLRYWSIHRIESWIEWQPRCGRRERRRRAGRSAAVAARVGAAAASIRIICWIYISIAICIPCRCGVSAGADAVAALLIRWTSLCSKLLLAPPFRPAIRKPNLTDGQTKFN